MIHTARGKPRRVNITKEAILMAPLPPITCSIPPEYSLTDIKLMTAVLTIQANTIKLLNAHTSLEPIRLHMGSIKKELMPRTTYAQKKKKRNTKLTIVGKGKRIVDMI